MKMYKDILLQEAKVLKRLEGRWHIVGLLADHDKVEQLYRENQPGNSSDTHNTIFEEGDDPFFLLMEYIPNGTLLEFQTKTWKKDPPIPNRILWQIFLCLLEATFEMAELGEDFCHKDQHLQNVMFGDVDSYLHRLVPIVKYIDFGNATGHEWKPGPPYQQRTDLWGHRPTGIQVNIYDVGGLMEQLFRQQSFIAGHWYQIGHYPNLDGDLLDLVVRCRSRDPARRPTIEDCLKQIDTAIVDKTRPEHFPNRSHSANETDDFIRTYVHDHIFHPNADPSNP
ncbi:putative Protein kinase domain-containing protein [Seiridium cardinale]|uniref:Protein kinase domain-containing protein n=1 Tax=Seiridium cardinale TaxID=138064 RepID=A0ABR2XR70_9PEZI